MKFWKVFCCMSLLLLTMVFAGCGNDGNKYEGKWTGLENPNNPRSYIHQISIDQNGDNFIVKRKIGSYNEFHRDNLEWNDSTEDIDTTTLKDGKLVEGGLSATTYTYLEKDNTLLYSAHGGVTLQKDDDGKIFDELQEQAAEATQKYWEEHPLKKTSPINDNPFAKYGKTKW